MPGPISLSLFLSLSSPSPLPLSIPPSLRLADKMSGLSYCSLPGCYHAPHHDCHGLTFQNCGIHQLHCKHV
ncbi:hypothetical protein LEMLEM_LOCUS4783 [Lemmus lemmus]